MAKLYDKKSLVWIRKSGSGGYDDRDMCWFLHKKSVKEVVDNIMTGEGWQSLTVAQRSEFINAVKNNEVKIGYGYNDSSSNMTNWPAGTLYVSNMYSIRSWRETLDTFDPNAKSWCWGAYKYRIMRTENLSDELKEAILHQHSNGTERKMIEKNVYGYYNFILNTLLTHHPYLNQNISSDYESDTNSDRINSNIRFYTEGIFKIDSYNAVVEETKRIITTALDMTKQVSGYEIYLPDCDDYAQGLINTRHIHNKDTQLKETNKSKTTAEFFQEIIDGKNELAIKESNKNILYCSGKLYKDILDDSVVTLDIANDEIRIDCWTNVPDCFVTTRLERDRAKEHYERYQLYIWGKLKTIYQTFGKDQFMKLMQGKLKQNTID